MGWSVPIARIAGIRIYLHLTFLLLVALVAWVDSRPGAAGAWEGTVWVVLLFGCVLVHELAHSILARRLGATVRSIVLLPIGGVSLIEDMPQKWSEEFWVAAVGPLASLALGVAAMAASVAVGATLWPVNLAGGGLLPRLAWANLLLGGFNLLPAFPLDGGRVLRAALERRHDLGTATRMAATLGRSLAVAMMVFGLFWNLWLILIGAFVFVGATQEEQATTARIRLMGHPVSQFMRSPVAALDAGLAVDDLRHCWAGPQVVTVAERYYGLALGSEVAAAPSGTLVADLTDRDAPVLSVEEDVGRTALERLITSGYPALAVVHEGRPVGVLALADIAAWLSRGPAPLP